MANTKEKLRIIPLGGLNEIGKNMTAYQYQDDIIIVDCGMSFPEEDLLGIDAVIPDFSFLKRNRKKIKGLVITHGHEDHIGSIPYFLKEFNVPIYGTPLTIGLIENKLKEHKFDHKVRLKRINAGDTIKLASFSVEAIRVNHSIPDAVSFCIESPIGRVIHTGDFKVDFTPIDGEQIDLNRFAQLGAEGVLCMLADSTNAERPGYTMSERTVGDTIENIFRQAEGRVIIASFASNVHRMQQIINAAHLNNRKVAFSGRSMLNVSKVASELGYLSLPKDFLIETRDIERYPENEICVITTGSQGEAMSALVRMANSSHRDIEVRDGDLVILSSSPIPGNEKSVKKIINLLFEKGANVIYEKLADVHVSGHAKQEELKLMHSLVKPKFFIPVHGEYTHLHQHAKIAEDLGMDAKDIFITENGGVIEFTKTGQPRRAKSVQAGRVFIDGLGVGDVGNIVLRDRKHLSEDGLIVVVITLDGKSGKLVSDPDIVSRGFVYVRESEQLINSSRNVVKDALDASLESNVRDWTSLKNTSRDALSNYIYENTRRRPMILPIIVEV